jgi:hypothetical protein
MAIMLLIFKKQLSEKNYFNWYRQYIFKIFGYYLTTINRERKDYERKWHARKGRNLQRFYVLKDLTFDVMSYKADDYYITITESKKFTEEDGSFHSKHKILFV